MSYIYIYETANNKIYAVDMNNEQHVVRGTGKYWAVRRTTANTSRIILHASFIEASICTSSREFVERRERKK